MQAIKRPLVLSLALFLTLSIATISLYTIQNNYQANNVIAMAGNN
jgi:hypothetical protein